jgi:SAM-dependent methyltransferase
METTRLEAKYAEASHIETRDSALSARLLGGRRMQGDYRDRLYKSYRSTRPDESVPCSVADFKSQEPYYRHLIKTHLPRDRNASILELGCGCGMFVHFVKQAGYRNIRGVDTSEEDVGLAKRMEISDVYEAEIIQTLLSTPSESYDVIIMADVLEHFLKDELIEIADEVRRILRHNGKWICRVPNAEAIFSMRMRYGDLTHQLAFTGASIGQLMRSCGFRRFDCFEETPVVHNVKSAVRWSLWQTMRLWSVLWLSVVTGGFARNSLFSQNIIAVGIR